MKRTEAFDVDKSFTVDCEITKTHTLANGRRVIRGVASGVLEDRDGERVSARAIAEMAMQPVKGMKLVAGTHAQNWTNEIGDVVKMELDTENDELIVTSELPPEGVDPLADKAWREMNVEGRKFGYSIGGKLTRTFNELTERAGAVVKRKVLDGVRLKHMVLTDTPSYRQSFVDVVAKTASDVVFADDVPTYDEPEGQELSDALEIRKAAAPDARPDEDDEPEAPAGQAAEQGADATPPGQAVSPGSPEQAAQETPAAPEAPSDAEEAQQLPKAIRHLACPNCGEEFAADLPDTPPATDDTTTNDAEKPETGKTAKETAMDPMEQLRALAATPAEDVEKTPEPTKTEPEVEKTTPTTDELELGDVAKMLGAAHAHSEARTNALEAGIKELGDVVAKAVQGLAERVNALPQGRRSTARVLPPAAEVEVGKTGTDDDPVKKAVEDPNASALDVLKAQNEQTYGIR